ncbi:hypothetical protein K4K61_000010 [Colletotrichum sp. SAR11_59]|nr:hypothetical protein K4K61_000010 [Colletotrichum sp. SAR11_59]
MSQKRKVLMLTNSEYGQANIFLATCYALMGTASNVEIHLASFAPIRTAVIAASEAGIKAHPNASPINFYEIHGTNYFKALLSPEVEPDLTLVDNMFTPGLTMARHMGIKWMILSPNTLKDLALPLQPKAAFFWKYPWLTLSYIPGSPED